MPDYRRALDFFNPWRGKPILLMDTSGFVLLLSHNEMNCVEFTLDLLDKAMDVG